MALDISKTHASRTAPTGAPALESKTTETNIEAKKPGIHIVDMNPAAPSRTSRLVIQVFGLIDAASKKQTAQSLLVLISRQRK